MEYFKLLQLAKEPFSNSPDPAFFYASEQHKDCIQKLEIALRLRRGLNVVTGEVGTGKTTLCRQLIQAFSGDPRISACLVLDPDFSDPRSFLSAVAHMMTSCKPGPDDTIPAMKEHLKNHLFQKGVEEDQTVVLIVDEGQKMPPACLETLRELLNFETNEFKLLQIIIFAQNEFADTLNQRPNLADRINLYYRLTPLNFKDSRALIHHRLKHAVGPEGPGRRLFSLPALWRIFRLSGGYPRKIIHLCHQCLLAMIIQNKSVVGWRIVDACARRTFSGSSFFRPIPVAIVLLLLAGMGFVAWHYSDTLQETAQAIQSKRENTDSTRLLPQTTDTEKATNHPVVEPSQIVLSPETSAITVAGQAEAISPPPSEQTAATPVAEQTRAVSLSPGEQTTAATSEAAPSRELSQTDDLPNDLPTVLGQVTVTMGDTLGGLIQKVYGAYTYRFHQAVLDANPKLADPDRLDVGQMLLFPALSTDTTNTPDAIWWVTLSREPNLGAAVSVLRREADSPFPLRLLVSWTREEGLFFRVALKTCFENRDAAELERRRIVPMVSAPPDIICLRESDTRFFGSLGELKGFSP